MLNYHQPNGERLQFQDNSNKSIMVNVNNGECCNGVMVNVDNGEC